MLRPFGLNVASTNGMKLKHVRPNFFLVGAHKSGTTSLYFCLKQHPQVFMPALKEPHFFSRFRPYSEMPFPHPRVSDVAGLERLLRRDFPELRANWSPIEQTLGASGSWS